MRSDSRQRPADLGQPIGRALLLAEESQHREAPAPPVAGMLRLGATCGDDALSTVAAVVGFPPIAPKGRIPAHCAYLVAMERMQHAYRERGIFP